MSKALTYDEAETVIHACVVAGIQPPSLKWFMGKRRPKSWQMVLDAADAVRNECDMFRWIMDEDREQYEDDYPVLTKEGCISRDKKKACWA